MAGELIDPVTERPMVKTSTTHDVIEEKPAATATATTTAIDSPDPDATTTFRPERAFKQAIYAIVGGVALPCIPIIIVTAVLLYFIFHYRVVPRPGYPELFVDQDAAHDTNFTQFIHDIRHSGGSPAYYVQYNPSTITTIASWTGRVIPYLSSSIMALVAFFAARHIVVKSKHGRHTELPTPEQLTILIDLLGGKGFGPLRDTMLFRWTRKERLVHPLPAAFAALFLITSLGVLIPIIDTWFGVATQPATITQLYNVTAGQYHAFGRQLNDSDQLPASCAQGPGSVGGQYQGFWWPCNFFMALPHLGDIFLQGTEEVSRLQLGGNTVNLISNYTGPANSRNPAPHAPNQTFYFYGDSRSSHAVDFKARSLAISTTCEIATNTCFDNYANQTAFKCPAGFDGDLSMCQPSVWPAKGEQGTCTTGIGFAPDPQLSRSTGFTNLTDYSGFSAGEITVLLRQNPIYFGAWSMGYPAAGDVNNALFANNDPQVFVEGYTSAVWFLNCSATVWDVTYTYANGALHSFDAVPAADDWGAFFSAPFAWNWLPLQSVTLSLSSMAYLASYTAQTSADLAHIWANEFSKSALGLSVGVFAPMQNDLEQLRNSTIGVARVPLIPLYLLLGTKFIYVIVVIILAVGAYCFTHPSETEVVKAQLSVKGLAAAHFDSPELLQHNVVKEVADRLEQAKGVGSPNPNTPTTAVNSPMSPQPPLHRAATAPAESGARDGGDVEQSESKPKVGLMPTRAGTWQFVVRANGAWQSVKPIVQSFVLADARQGELGTMGDVYAAWK